MYTYTIFEFEDKLSDVQQNKRTQAKKTNI